MQLKVNIHTYVHCTIKVYLLKDSSTYSVLLCLYSLLMSSYSCDMIFTITKVINLQYMNEWFFKQRTSACLRVFQGNFMLSTYVRTYITVYVYKMALFFGSLVI